ncbi:hypothetical protein KKF61_08340 [Patescibacteria group bacterium]|nr:hypothetical protein [Patescibacteria group bacterium]
MIELDAFENAAIALKERETEVFLGKAELAHYAVEHDANVKGRPASNFLAHLWGQSTTHTVNRLALIFEVFGADEITPDVPLKLYGAALETDDPSAWLARAIAERWSARQLRDKYGSLKDKHLSSCQFAGEVEITVWQPATGEVAFVGLQISGESPRVARVTVREVLDKGE